MKKDHYTFRHAFYHFITEILTITLVSVIPIYLILINNKKDNVTNIFETTLSQPFVMNYAALSGFLFIILTILKNLGLLGHYNPAFKENKISAISYTILKPLLEVLNLVPSISRVLVGTIFFFMAKSLIFNEGYVTGKFAAYTIIYFLIMMIAIPIIETFSKFVEEYFFINIKEI